MNVRQLIEALQALPPDLPVYVAGDGSSEDELLEVAAVEDMALARLAGRAIPQRDIFVEHQQFRGFLVRGKWSSWSQQM